MNMGRPSKWIAAWGLPPLREHWSAINRQQREKEAQKRAKRKTRDKRRRKCRCEAYPWPHRPGGGLCRWPDPPTERWKPKHPWSYRPYRERYAGLRRQIARSNGLHPIRDRAKIDLMMTRVLQLAKQLKRACPKVKYRNIEITNKGITGYWRSVGPDWQRGE
jgi:hypothetical protein